MPETEWRLNVRIKGCPVKRGPWTTRAEAEAARDAKRQRIAPGAGVCWVESRSRPFWGWPIRTKERAPADDPSWDDRIDERREDVMEGRRPR